MRTKDRQFVSEVVRAQSLWHHKHTGPDFHILETLFDERLYIKYGKADQILVAEYSHWDRDTGEQVCKEVITQKKLKRVLHLLQAERGRDGHLYLRINGVSVRKDSIAEAWALQGRLKPTAI